MTSVQRKFAAGLITLFIVSSTSYTGKTTKLTQDDCNANSDLATKLRNCLTSKGIVFDKLCVTKDHIDVVLNVGTVTPVDCRIINAIRDCTLETVSAEPVVYEVTISIAPSTSGGPAQLIYSGHAGTGHDTDSMPTCTSMQDLLFEGTVSINAKVVEKKVSADAGRFGVKVYNLRVEVKKGKDGKPFLQVSGKASSSNASDSRIIGIVTALVNKYTGVLEINTGNLKVLPQIGKDSRIK
jgi:hypothetical protein